MMDDMNVTLAKVEAHYLSQLAIYSQRIAALTEENMQLKQRIEALKAPPNDDAQAIPSPSAQ